MKTIITGIDFTQSSYNAARYAAMLAQKVNCKLTLFNMYDVPLIHSNSGLYFISYSTIRDSNEDKLNSFLEKLRKEFPKVVAECYVTTGSLRVEIASFIKKHSVEYVVLGLATKTRFSKFIYGSHSTEVAGKVSAPVIIMPEQYKKHQLKKVLLGVDNAEKLHKLSLKRLEGFLKETKSDMAVLHVRTEDELFSQNKKKVVKINNRNYSVEVVRGNSIVEGVKKYAAQNKTDLISILSHKHSVFYNLFNETNTKSIAFASKIPVMAIHD